MDPDVQNRLTREILALVVRSEREAVAHIIRTLKGHIETVAPAAAHLDGTRTLKLFAQSLDQIGADVDKVFASKLEGLTDA